MSLKTMIIIVLLCLPAFSALAGPMMRAEQLEHDFGSVVQGKKIEHVFVVRNAGDEVLNIDQVRSSCGCTAALLSTSQIPPGGTGEIRTTFDSGRFRGPVSKSVHVYGNDPARPRIDFHLRGTVRPKLEPTPADIDLGVLAPGGKKEATLTLTNHGNETIALAAARATVPGVEARLSATAVPPGQTVEVTIRAELPPGSAPLSGYLLVQPQSPEPEIRIPIRARGTP